MIYSEAERKEIERVYGVFKDYIHASKFLDFVWSEKLGYLLLHIDPTKNTIEEDQIITSADELCAELFNEVATDVFQEAKREHFYPDADDDEIAEIRRRWQPPERCLSRKARIVRCCLRKRLLGAAQAIYDSR